LHQLGVMLCREPVKFGMELLGRRHELGKRATAEKAIRDSAEKVCSGRNEYIFRPQMPYNQFSELD